ncbi:hypothetical protein DMH04_47430 [Kibdelosporangium aridum]|uniref:Uncharacterized protein n=1 Tax=Kibdelosporangium aridum TaxID=2030 RepID=A0A428YKU1_KIBAR|nr:hypothetical protein [Kibdelosporangium aridum]RSM68131.1 hypothetical protein DMH04_47430 [Kibdelosporangium aridum]
MTTANTENEDLEGLVKPKKAPLRPTGPVHHQGVPVTVDIDTEEGGDTTDGPVHHQGGPVDSSGGTQPDGPVHHQTEPEKTP